MTSPQDTPHDVTTDDLLGLVAGTLGPADFSRVAAAVKHSPALQAQLASLEQIRHRMELALDLAPTPAQAQALADRVLHRTGAGIASGATAHRRAPWSKRLLAFLSASPTPARWAYALVLVQAVGMAWWASGALPSNDAADVRSAGIDSKQLGEVPGAVVVSVSFDPTTPETTVRGLLLDIEAQIIAGPTQLGQYKLSVARNRRDLALGKLKEAPFVTQLTELEARPAPPGENSGGPK